MGSMRRTVTAERVLPAAFDVVVGVLADDPARQESTMVLALGEGATVGQQVEVSFAPPAVSPEAAAWDVAWAPVAHRRLLPAFDGSLVVTADGWGSRLRLRGGYRPPFGPLGAVFDAAVGGRIARRSIDRFLDGLVQHVAAEAVRRRDLAPFHPAAAPPDLNPRRRLA
jgi:hypothetical protein